MTIKVGDKEFNLDGYANTNEIARAVNEAYRQGKTDTKTDIAKECKYLLNCGMGKIKALNHLIKILGAEETEECPFKEGEIVEVSDCGRLWCIRYFSHISTDNEFKYRVFLHDGKGNEGWKYCRKYGTLGKENEE